MKRLLAGIQFLTVVPAGCDCSKRDLGRSTFFFPVIGLIAGVAAVGINFALSLVFPPLIVNVLLVIAMLAVSGGLHMDGLADTADGFLSARPRERILEIMKDSHIGAMGVIAIVFALFLKVAALVSVPINLRWPTLLLTPLAGRCAMVLEMAVLPYARAEGGTGLVFATNKSRLDPVWAIAFLAVTSYCAVGRTGLMVSGSVVAFTMIFSLWCKRKIGGFTGDTLGAVCELAELAPALVAVAATK